MKLSYEDFIGNEQAVRKVKLLTHEADGDNIVRIPDMAFLGPSGHGKNMLAEVIAAHLGRKLETINSTVVRDPFQFRSKVTGGEFNSTGKIILLDECHQLPRRIQDNLLSALEHPRELHTSHKDQIFKDSLPQNLSFIFATTHGGNIRKALMNRLEAIEFLEYSKAEMLEMAVKYLKRVHGLAPGDLESKAVIDIANRARSGRQLSKFCDNIILYMKQKGIIKLDTGIVEACFNILGVDKNGLTRVDRKMLTYMTKVNTFVGLDTLEALMNMTKKDIKENVEPYLLRRGFIVRKSSGRIITPKGRRAVEA